MTNPKSKADIEAGMLGETAKNYCESWLLSQIYNRKKQIHSKYFEKGNLCENAAIERVNDTFLSFYSKNELGYENEFMTGTPDIIGTDIIIDVKNSYDFSTFPLLKPEIENKDYIYQLQGYMHITGKKKAKLIYCLENLPDELIEIELNKLGLEFTEENAAQFKYDDVIPELRIKSYELIYDHEIIKKVESQVIKCRNYINTLIA